MNRTLPATLAAFALALALPACRKPPERTPEGTLGLLRGALVDHQPPLDRVADVRLYTETAAVAEISTVQRDMGIPATPDALENRLRRDAAEMTPERVFAGATTLLRNGHCEKIADAPLPDLLRQAPPPAPRWTGRLLETQQSVARRLTNAFAADFRCDGGPSFRAAFIHPRPDDPTLRVVWIGPAGER